MVGKLFSCSFFFFLLIFSSSLAPQIRARSGPLRCAAKHFFFERRRLQGNHSQSVSHAANRSAAFSSSFHVGSRCLCYETPGHFFFWLHWTCLVQAAVSSFGHDGCGERVRRDGALPLYTGFPGWGTEVLGLRTLKKQTEDSTCRDTVQQVATWYCCLARSLLYIWCSC